MSPEQAPPQTEQRPSPWPRRLRWLVLAALLLSPPVLWWTSGHFRLVVYELAYPHLSQSNQKWAFERIRENEERPDVAWRCYAEAAEDPVEAWGEAFSACQDKGDFEFRGLEDDLIGVLEDPGFAAVHERALWTAIDCRVKDPRLEPILTAFLDHPDLSVLAAYALSVNGREARALPVLIRALKAPLGENGEVPASDAFTEVGPPLAALRILGPPGRPAVPAIRPWTRSPDLATRQMALAALCSVSDDPRWPKQLRATLDEPEQGGRFTAILLAECDLGDAAVCRILEAGLEPAETSIFTVPILQSFARLGAAGRPALPILTRYLQHEDPAIRDLARRAIAAIEGEAP